MKQQLKVRKAWKYQQKKRWKKKVEKTNKEIINVLKSWFILG